MTTFEDIADTIRSGGNFSDGLAAHEKVFDRLYVNMVKAGEAGGAQCVLRRCAADSSLCGDGVQRQGAMTLASNLASDDAKGRDLPQGEISGELGGDCAAQRDAASAGD